VDYRVLKSLEKNESIELSTGLSTDTEPSQGVHNGVAYSGIAKNYRPDHLAILPDMVGACSIKDGCGVLVNEGQENWLKSIVNSLIKEPVMAKAKTDAQRKEIVDHMIANCDCWAEEDREVLNTMSDVKLDALKAHVESHKQAEAVANAARKGFENGDVGYTFNEKDLKFEGKPKPAAKPEAKKEEPVTNTETKKPITADEWMAAAPPEIQSVVRNAMETEHLQKLEQVKIITANKANLFTEDQLLKRPLGELRAIAALAKVEESRPSYFGSSVPATNAQSDKVDEDDYLAIPVINWAELSKG
jgi:hypothetical protein